MGDIPPAGSILSDLAYHDYLALLCSSDAEWSRRRPEGDDSNDYAFEPFLDSLVRFDEECREYASGVSLHFERFLDVECDCPQAPIADWLFNALSYIPFGHADTLSVVLLDDVDPVHYLTAAAETAIEEVSLAFCPKLESLGVRQDDGAFCELHTLLGRREPPRRRGKGMARAETLEHDFQRDLPLAVFTKYKMDGLATAGQGLLLQQAVLRTMVKKIRETVDLFQGPVGREDTVKGLIPNDDVGAIKVAFLDLQGAEEIGTVMFCRNYSVAMTSIAALRSLTFDDVFRMEARALAALNGSLPHRAIIAWAQELLRRKEQCCDATSLVSDHVFRWTHTVAATSPTTLLDPGGSKCSGAVEAIGEFQISPGHLGAVERGARHDKAERAQADAPAYHRYQVGTGDTYLAYGDSVELADSAERASGAALPLLPLASALSLIAANLRGFGLRQREGDQGRHVVDITTTLAIPVPCIKDGNGTDVICRPLDDRHLSPLCAVLPEIQRSLFYDGSPRGGRTGATRGHGRFNLRRLKNCMRMIGVPVALRRTIQYLYQDFATVLGDPFLFDLVLGLYDAFATLYAVLTQHLRRSRAEEVDKLAGEWLGILDEKRVEQLAMLVDATHNALMHRVLRAYPEAPIRDMAIDFRGGLNQLLAAADAPMKCGLGILRKFTRADRREALRDRVGALTRVSFCPGAACYSLHFGCEDNARLAYFAVDVPHVLHPPSYRDYLHEAFHLVYDDLCHQHNDGTEASPDAANGRPPAFSISQPVMRDRVGEVFANLMEYLIVFDMDRKTFLYRKLCAFSQGLTSVGLDDGDSAMRFVELMIRLFLVVEAVPPDANGEPGGGPRFASMPGDYRPQTPEDPEKALARFEDMVGELAFMWSSHDELWCGPTGRTIRQTCRRHFERIYPKVRPLMPGIWSEAMAVCRRYAEASLRSGEEWSYHPNEVDRQVKNALSEGKPLIRCLYREGTEPSGDPPRSPAAADAEGPGLDPLVLISRLLRLYLLGIRSAEGKEVHLKRSGEGMVVYPEQEGGPEQGGGWYGYQVEQGAAAMFCPVPAFRRERLRKQIVMLKTCWDISTNLRVRRLWVMVQDSWSHCQDWLKAQGIAPRA